jgi:hypothetical protein
MIIEKDFKIYGPYLSDDNRLRCVLVHKITKKKQTMSYPRVIMIKHLQRWLEEDEEVDHIDKNPLNNEITNLQVLIKNDHVKMDVKRLVPVVFSCPSCNNSFSLQGNKLSRAKSARKRGKAGPFCSRECAGRYGANVQNGANKLEVALISDVYTDLKRSLTGETL